MLHVKPKTIVTAVLLLFVAASVGYLVVKETGGRSADNATPGGTPPVSEHGLATEAATEDNAAGQKVVAYYFHGNVRCITCRTIEAYATEAIETGFPEQVKDGRLEWRVVNVEDPGNGHFIKDFELTTRSVVLVRLAAGKQQDWTNLQRVWELVRGEKGAFLQYIQDETRAYLEAAGE